MLLQIRSQVREIGAGQKELEGGLKARVDGRTKDLEGQLSNQATAAKDDLSRAEKRLNSQLRSGIGDAKRGIRGLEARLSNQATAAKDDLCRAEKRLNSQLRSGIGDAKKGVKDVEARLSNQATAARKDLNRAEKRLNSQLTSLVDGRNGRLILEPALFMNLRVEDKVGG